MSRTTPILTDRRLWLGFFHHRRANRLAFFDKLDLTMLGEACPGRNQMTHNHVFLEAPQFVDLTECGGFREYAGRILERSGRNKAVRFE